MNPEVRLKLDRLLTALCDGQLTTEQHARLEELLNGDVECQDHYLEYLDMHAQLLIHPVPCLTGKEDGKAAIPAVSLVEESGRVRRGRPMPQVLRYALVAAATLAASFLIQISWRHPSEPGVSHDTTLPPSGVQPPLSAYVATLTQTGGCIWENAGELWRVGSRLPPGELRLRKGIAKIRFDSGPDVVVEGPAHLRIDSSTAATVLRGNVVFRADETAAPFDLNTPSSTLMDLGTEYAVAVGPHSEEIHVFDGEVQRTPRKGPAGVEPEHLKAGEARRYGRSSVSSGQPTPLDPTRFVRQVSDSDQPSPDPAAGLLAYEGFDYQNPELLRAGKANGGFGWTSPWKAGFARPLNEGDQNRLVLNVKEGLVRSGAAAPAVGGCFDYTGFTEYYRRLATPVRMNTDEVYYLSFLFRRHGPQADPVNAVAVLLRTSEEFRKEKRDHRKRLNVGVDRSNHVFTHLGGVGTRTPLPLSNGETYLLVAKIAASASNPDQVFIRVYGPEEPIERQEPGSWSVVGPPFRSDLVFDWLEVHINSKKRQMIDEIRLGTTWSSVAAPWAGAFGAGKEGGP